MPSLYELKGEEQTLRQLLSEDLTEEECDAVLARHRELTTEDLPTKFEGRAKFIKNNEALAKALKEESARLAARAKTVTRAVDWVKNDTKGWLEAAGLKDYRAGVFTLSPVKCGGKRKMELHPDLDPDKLPDEFVTIIPEQRVPNIDALRTALEAGEPVPGIRPHEVSIATTEAVANLLARGTRLSIR